MLYGPFDSSSTHHIQSHLQSKTIRRVHAALTEGTDSSLQGSKRGAPDTYLLGFKYTTSRSFNIHLTLLNRCYAGEMFHNKYSMKTGPSTYKQTSLMVQIYLCHFCPKPLKEGCWYLLGFGRGLQC